MSSSLGISKSKLKVFLVLWFMSGSQFGRNQVEEQSDLEVHTLIEQVHTLIENSDSPPLTPVFLLAQLP